MSREEDDLRVHGLESANQLRYSSCRVVAVVKLACLVVEQLRAFRTEKNIQKSVGGPTAPGCVFVEHRDGTEE